MFNIQQIHKSEGNPHLNRSVKVIFDDDFNNYTKYMLHSYFLMKFQNYILMIEHIVFLDHTNKSSQKTATRWL